MFRVQGLGFKVWGFPKVKGTLVGGVPYILGSIFGSTFFWETTIFRSLS